MVSLSGQYKFVNFLVVVSLFACGTAFAQKNPDKKPNYILTILIDEPKGAPQIWKHSRREAGWNAVYLAGKIIQKIGPSLAINDLELIKQYASNSKNN